MKRIEVRAITNWLSILKSKQWDYFGTRHFRDNTFKPETINPCPEFINEKRLWAHLGTFMDYMIRKFFREGLISPDAEIILEDYLISEISLEHLYHKEDDRVRPLGGTQEEIQRSLALYKSGIVWIDNYKTKHWKETIQDCWLMASLDSIYRSGRFPTIQPLKESELDEILKFLEAIFNWLSETFSSAKKVYLNPTVGVADFVLGDADLIIDNTLLDIKTTKHPHKTPNNEVNQLLLYVSLCHYHTSNNLQNFPIIDKITFLFPQQLTLWERDLKDFTTKDREEMITKLKDLSEGKSNVI